MFDALTKLFEGKNINRKMTLRNQLKNVKIHNVETIQSYFKRVSQIKEQLEAMDEEVENAEIVMTTLNGLPKTWDSFVQGIYARKKLVKFNRLWEEFSQEEARIATREEKMGSEDQALTVQSKKSRRDHHHHHHSKGKHSSYKKSQLRCYTCDEIGHFAKDCPRNKRNSHKKKNNKRRHHAHAVEDDEPSTKRMLDRIFHLLWTIRCSTALNGSNPEQMKDRG